MNIEDAVLPDSIDASDVVEIESSAVARAQRYDEDHGRWDDNGVRDFNPQNGRWYETDMVGARKNTRVVSSVEVECAYDDCNGRHESHVYGTIRQSCPECGASKMGREQFETDE